MSNAIIQQVTKASNRIQLIIDLLQMQQAMIALM